MKYATYLAFRMFILLFRLVPLPLLYGLSNLFFVVIYHLAGYRKSVVAGNLKNSFPEKKEEERIRIMHGFYRHFCDILIESLKGFTLSEKEVITRYTFLNPEIPDGFYRQGRSVIVVGGHYANWEWAGIASGPQMLHKPVGFYKPLSNPYIDRYMRSSRVQGRSMLASIAHTPETFRADYGEPAAFYMVADQSPSSPRFAHWVTFLGQDTAALHGPEKYARLFNLPVLFACPEKLARGQYAVRFELLESEPLHAAPGEITARYMKRLEAVIRQRPEYYLWSHRRWKLRRSPNPSIPQSLNL